LRRAFAQFAFLRGRIPSLKHVVLRLGIAVASALIARPGAWFPAALVSARFGPDDQMRIELKQNVSAK
jgi:hypothetical protein